MTAYTEALLKNNGIKVISICEEAVKASTTYQEALAQVENLLWAAWGQEGDELSKGLTDQLWIANI